MGSAVRGVILKKGQSQEQKAGQEKKEVKVFHKRLWAWV
jgi:hypothetical protein